MKINIKLKKLFVKHINSLEREYYSISGIALEDKTKLFVCIQDYLSNDSFFLYTSGSTDFNDKLEIIFHKDIVEYFHEDYILYTIDTLDALSISFCEDSPYNFEGYEIVVTGKLVPILELLMHTFEFNHEESILPKV